MKSKAEDFHIDPNQVFVFGDSSGAHTALLTGLTDNMPDFETDLYPSYSSSVRGIIDFSGPTNLLLSREEDVCNGIKRDQKGPFDDLFWVDNIESIPETAGKASCERYIKAETPIPPILIVHGTEDDIVSVNQSILLYNYLNVQNKEVYFYSL